MRTPTSFFVKASATGCVLFCAAAVSLLASDVVLQKVPTAGEQSEANRSNSPLGPQASFALINYNLRDAQTKAHALYVSSGGDLALADKMIDDQAATSFGFKAEDASPTTVIDLGKISTLRRISAIYSARAGAVDFYILQTLPGTTAGNTPASLKIGSKMFANLKPIGSAVDDGTRGSATIDFPATSGRYIMLRWSPASQANTAFTVAEVSAFSPTRGNLLASNRNFSTNATTSDSKDVADSKDVGDSKDIPEEESPAPPAEGPPPSLPNPPPFTFIPQLVPVSN